jgi:hypothetical protein
MPEGRGLRAIYLMSNTNPPRPRASSAATALIWDNITETQRKTQQQIEQLVTLVGDLTANVKVLHSKHEDVERRLSKLENFDEKQVDRTHSSMDNRWVIGASVGASILLFFLGQILQHVKWGP